MEKVIEDNTELLSEELEIDVNNTTLTSLMFNTAKTILGMAQKTRKTLGLMKNVKPNLIKEGKQEKINYKIQIFRIRKYTKNKEIKQRKCSEGRRENKW